MDHFLVYSLRKVAAAAAANEQPERQQEVQLNPLSEPNAHEQG